MGNYCNRSTTQDPPKPKKNKEPKPPKGKIDLKDLSQKNEKLIANQSSTNNQENKKEEEKSSNDHKGPIQIEEAVEKKPIQQNHMKALGAIHGFLKGYTVGAQLANLEKADITSENVKDAYDRAFNQDSITFEAKLSQSLAIELEMSKNQINLDQMLKAFLHWYTNEDKDNLSLNYVKAAEGEDVQTPLTQHYLNVLEKCPALECNLSLLRMVPIAIWGHKLDSDSLFAAVKLVVMLTNSHELVVEACYLYCFAIQQLINGKTATEAFNLTKEESERRANITGLSTIKYWIENDIEASSETEEMPNPHYRPISYIKVSLLWSFYYLRNNQTYEEAVKDIISRGGDTRNNAAIVGALIGAAHGISEEEILSFEGKDQQLVTKIVSIVDNAPETTAFRVIWSGKTMNLEELKTHLEQELTVAP